MGVPGAGSACSLPSVPATDDSKGAAGGVDGPGTDDIRARVAGISWYHSIDLGNGIVTPGNPPDERMIEAGLPRLRGQTVLDIGAWDGYWSFLAEKRQAAR